VTRRVLLENEQLPLNGENLRRKHAIGPKSGGGRWEKDYISGKVGPICVHT
jgi:hypothetical protein